MKLGRRSAWRGAFPRAREPAATATQQRRKFSSRRFHCAFGLLLLAYDPTQSALHPGGVQSARIAALWWTFFWALLVVFILVMIFLFIGLWRRRLTNEGESPIIKPGEERGLTRFVTVAVVLTVLTLFALLGRDFVTGNQIFALSDAGALEIKLTGHQWWWEVQYQDPQPSNIVTTANEIHIPIGRVVKFDLASTDVIHSFWVPNLHGKKDLVPGHPTTVLLRADEAGEYHGQCAEFCGYQHAHMRLLIVAEQPERFQAWLAAQRQDSPPPSNASARLGRQVFLTSQCVMCHTIGGTRAFATLGPNLSHLGSRQTLAAGSFPNTRGYLAGWIVNPQNLKPGAMMPPNLLAPDSLNALIDYLEALK